jgi:predicted alpha/beta hydrolase family esterase
MKFVVFHGTYGDPDSNWFPWLKQELEQLGHEVWVPKLPTPENQSVDSWCKATQEQVPFIYDKDTVLIGHSCGALWVLESLSRKRPEPIQAAFYVSGFLDDLGNLEYDKLNHTFTHYPFDWSLIRKNASKAFVFHGDNDPYVPIKQAEKLAKKLGVEPIVIKNGGHLNAAAGYTKFPELLNKIKEVI